MCGITGYTHRSPAVSPSAIKEATDCLIHRGPDQQGTYESGHVSLGAVRLKIIDLCGGSQPFFSDDRKTVLVYNGEIYNYRELRKELEGAGPHLFDQERHRGPPPSVSAVGHGLLSASPRYVRGSLLAGRRATAGSGSRSRGNQAPVRLPLRRRHLFRLGIKNHSDSSRNSPPSGSNRTALLSGPQLRAWSALPARRNTETAAPAPFWSGKTAACAKNNIGSYRTSRAKTGRCPTPNGRSTNS